MSLRASGPTACVLQVSGEDDARAPVLSVLVKRTYRLGPDGACEIASDQDPLAAPEIDDARRGLLVRDADVYPLKPLTDVVVVGHAYPPQGARSFVASLAVGALEKRVLVTGDRRATLGMMGELVLSAPEPFERMPVSHDKAYGGLDAWAEEHVGNPWDGLAPYLQGGRDASLHSPHLYPRNPSGKGYLIDANRAAVERVELPNLEDPDDRLGPGRLAAGSPLRWPRMPLPWSLGWMSHAAFPRVAFAGAIRPFEPMSEAFTEVTRGLAPAGFPRLGPVWDVYDGRFLNGASLGLSLGPMGEGVSGLEFVLSHLHPRLSRLSFRLPRGAPKIATDGRAGKMNETVPVLHHIVIEPDDDKVSVVWRGAAPALRRYTLEELLKMPLRVDW